MATAHDLIAAVNAGDAELVGRIVADDPSLATARDAAGVSALMRALYRFDRAVTDVLLSADPELDAFEAAALGYIDRFIQALQLETDAAIAFSSAGADPARTVNGGGTPADIAEVAGHHDQAVRLLGVSPTAPQDG